MPKSQELKTSRSKIIYYVASSLDGYIAGVQDDISKFPAAGKGVDHYLADLKHFETVLMGRRTYEFGYQFGLLPGQPAYPHMKHYIFSETLQIDHLADNVHIEKLSAERIQEIRNEADTDIYLCGGGQLAGWLLDHGLIDLLKLKLNPIILGDGIPLFGNSTSSFSAQLMEKQSFKDGLQLLTYALKK
ncbi:dihydrofolate reductase family protein [Croceiramulus getboli]|nr:dihydrofolate reductase family protein [Flavobacteriaceae bacterium YJPT1-3]